MSGQGFSVEFFGQREDVEQSSVEQVFNVEEEEPREALQMDEFFDENQWDAFINGKYSV